MHPIPSGRRLAAAVAAIAILAAGCGTVTPSSPAAPSGPRASAAIVPSAAATGATPSGSGPTGTASAVPSAGLGASFDPSGQTVDSEVAVAGFVAPTDVANAGDGSGRLFVVEQAGRVRVVKDRAIAGEPFLDITNEVASGGERGLLGLAFHPDYPTDPRFFVDYTDLDGNTVIAQFQVSPTNPAVADRTSEKVLLHISQPFSNHNGGAVVFGPDGMLYIGMGDGGSAGDPQGNGQRLDTLLAKVLRLDVDPPPGSASPYVVPPDNPFLANPQAKPEIWLTGLRNPWRMRFDRATGDLWIGDVGQNAWEEIDVARNGTSGQNYGWNRMEGFHCYQPPDGCDQTGLTLPVAEYGHELGCAVIGGVVVRGPGQGALEGGYVFGDSCQDNLWLMDPAGDGRREPVIVGHLGQGLSSIAEGEEGNVYATSLSGELLRIVATGD
jgi:glucose/arabinose dehydrogenase